MTLPTTNNVPAPALRTTGPTRPGMRRPGTQPAPARNMPQNAFTRALAEANAQNLALRSQVAAQASAALPVSQQNGLPAEFQAMMSRITPAAAPAATTLQLPGGFGSIVDEAARKYGIDPALIAAVMETESKFNPDAVSRAGARGLMQLMPATARGLGVTDASDPLQNVLGGAKLLGQLSEKYKGNLELTLAAYNAGSGAVDKHGGIPPYAETRKYVPLVLAAYERYRAQAGTPAPATTVASTARR